MFIVEGVSTAILVTAIGDRMTQKRVPIDSPEAALAWCRRNSAGLVYSPAVSAGN